ncbi:glycosyltransferase [Acidothermaceae bacterium B102]|nr:glycosyltransferase [Acidothermaceae bacterium B102]
MVRFGFVSSYPPTLCGLATFTNALYAELVPPSGTAPVLRLVDTPQSGDAREVVGQVVAGRPADIPAAARLLDDVDVVVVQHEYGVYGGTDGDEVLALLAELSAPSVVVLHTVLSDPTPNQRRILEAVTVLADAVVTMTGTARERLAQGYNVDMSKVTVIPHGAAAVHRGQMPRFRTGAPTVLTWGLIGPGKGVEWAIEAMALLTDLDPAPRYLIAGQTHPKVLLHEGEAYRDRLQRRIDELDLSGSVVLDGRYRSRVELNDLVDAADIVLLPYDSTDQVTSGVLIEAVAALKPVVATRFPHAVELLSAGAGLIVPNKDPQAIADALRTLLTHRDLTAGMSEAAAATAPELLWPAVAERYRDLATQLVSNRVAA